MTNEKIIQWLWDFGHFRNPAFQTSHNVERDDLSKLTLDDHVVKCAVKSIQRLDANGDLCCALIHDRSMVSDGEVGPATRKLLTLPRCGTPDYGVAVDNLTGTGSWGNCAVSEHPSIRVNIDPSRMPDTVRAYRNRAIKAIRTAYAEIGLRVDYTFDDDPGGAQISKEFSRLLGPTIGWNTIPGANPSCSRQITGKLDTGFAPENYLFWAGLECHETGHGVRLGHTRGGIMNPSIFHIDPLTWIGDPSFNRLEEFFGGKSISIPGLPLPPVDPPDKPDKPSRPLLDLLARIWQAFLDLFR